jgi:multidrug efflux pump subunit AcrB
VFFLQGAARYLFTPLAMAVVFAMLASYTISRTLTPITIGLLLRKEHERRVPAPAGSTDFTQHSMRGSTASATFMAGCSRVFCGGGFSRRP